MEGYRAYFFPATFEGLYPKPFEWENVVSPPFFIFEELTQDSDVFQDADLSA